MFGSFSCPIFPTLFRGCQGVDQTILPFFLWRELPPAACPCSPGVEPSQAESAGGGCGRMDLRCGLRWNPQLPRRRAQRRLVARGSLLACSSQVGDCSDDFFRDLRDACFLLPETRSVRAQPGEQHLFRLRFLLFTTNGCPQTTHFLMSS